MRDFDRLGHEVQLGEILIGMDDAIAVHDLVSQELMLAAQSVKVVFGDSSDALRYRFSFTHMDPFELDAVDKYVSVGLVHQLEPESWELSLRIRSFRDAKRHDGKWTDYRFMTVGGDLLTAKKQVYLIRGVPNYRLTRRGQIVDDVVKSRRMFERPMLHDDCNELLATLGRTARRARAS